MNLECIDSNCSGLFCNQKHLSSPEIRSFRQLGGWADLRGIKRYRLRDFLKVLVEIFEFCNSILRSRKIVLYDGPSNNPL